MHSEFWVGAMAEIWQTHENILAMLLSYDAWGKQTLTLLGPMTMDKPLPSNHHTLLRADDKCNSTMKKHPKNTLG